QPPRRGQEKNPGLPASPRLPIVCADWAARDEGEPIRSQDSRGLEEGRGGCGLCGPYGPWCTSWPQCPAEAAIPGCWRAGSTPGRRVAADSGSEIKSYLVRLLTYLPGRPIAEIPISPQLLYEIGKLAAKLDKTLQKFHHPKLSSLHRKNFIWNLKNVPLLEKYLYVLGQNRNREIVEHVIHLFKEEVMTKLSHFRECINHGDLNDHNILIESSKSASGNAEYQVSGILDFDDMSYGYYVFELAITIMYMMIESKNPIQVGGHVLAGFESITPLTAVEKGALFLLVCSRFCQSLVMAAYSCQLYPENKDYFMVTAKTGWKHLQQMFDMGQKAVEEIWFETAKSYESGISM
uniref:Hydroxylysine kinase n=1 Tax=Macaca fascicularis TaxID=9541 RepID=A0A7N9IGX6_MACFA